MAENKHQVDMNSFGFEHVESSVGNASNTMADPETYTWDKSVEGQTFLAESMFSKLKSSIGGILPQNSDKKSDTIKLDVTSKYLGEKLNLTEAYDPENVARLKKQYLSADTDDLSRESRYYFDHIASVIDYSSEPVLPRKIFRCNKCRSPDNKCITCSAHDVDTGLKLHLSMIHYLSLSTVIGATPLKSTQGSSEEQHLKKAQKLNHSEKLFTDVDGDIYMDEIGKPVKVIKSAGNISKSKSFSNLPADKRDQGSSLFGKMSSPENKVQTVTKVFKCTHCNTNFSQKKYLQNHFYNCHPGETFVFSQSFINMKTNDVSFKGTVPKVQFTCKYCQIQCDSADELSEHYTVIHEIKSLYKCEVCSSVFCNELELEEHKEGSHRTHSCSVCGQSYTCGSHLSRHLIKAGHRSGETLYDCDLCKKQFWCLRSLKRHSQTKHKAAPSECAQ